MDGGLIVLGIIVVVAIVIGVRAHKRHRIEREAPPMSDPLPPIPEIEDDPRK